MSSSIFSIRFTSTICLRHLIIEGFARSPGIDIPCEFRRAF